MDLYIQNSKNYDAITIDKFLILIKNVKYERYDSEWYYGIKFCVEDDGNCIDPKFGYYDLIHNYKLGTRLLISNKMGWKDVPFYNQTFHMLPAGVEVLDLL